jgi:hypothetical protein
MVLAALQQQLRLGHKHCHKHWVSVARHQEQKTRALQTLKLAVHHKTFGILRHLE